MADPMPRHADAMKATLSGDVFDDPNWIVERKLDGVRCLAFRDGGSVTLESRNRLSLNERYAEVAAALDAQACERFVVDGEVVGISGGRSSFEALQRRGHDRGVKIAFYVFDVLWLDGADLRERPLRERKAALREALRFGDGTVRWTPYRRAHEGERLLSEACRNHWEGLIAKRADSPYTGKRSRDWLSGSAGRAGARHRRLHRTPRDARGLRRAARRLLRRRRPPLRGQGRHRLRRHELRTLGERMGAPSVPTRPSAPETHPPRGTTWVQPELVAQVAFSEWTRDGRLRHPRYLGTARRQVRA